MKNLKTLRFLNNEEKQRDLAKALDVHVESIRRWEREGLYEVPIKTIFKICKHYGIEIKELDLRGRKNEK